MNAERQRADRIVTVTKGAALGFLLLACCLLIASVTGFSPVRADGIHPMGISPLWSA